METVIALMVMTPASLPEVSAFKVPAFDVPNIVATTDVPGTKTGGHQDGKNCNSYLAIGDTWFTNRSHLEAHFEPNCMNLLTILSVLEVTIQCPKWFRTFSPMMVIELVLLSDCHVLLFLTKLGMGTVNLLHFKKLCLHLCC